MSDRFKVGFLSATPDSITLSFEITGIETDERTGLIVNIYKEEYSQNSRNESTFKPNYKKFGNVVLQWPFSESYAFEDLDSEGNYKFNCYLTTRNETYYAILMAGTKIDINRKKKTGKIEGINTSTFSRDKLNEPNQHLSETEKLLFYYANVQNHGLEIFKDRKDIHKSILDARVSKKWDNYTNSNYKFCKPIKNRDLRKKRMWLVAQGMELYEDIYGIKDADAGFKLLQNDWFMGPFYSYDPNFDKIKRPV